MASSRVNLTILGVVLFFSSCILESQGSFLEYQNQMIQRAVLTESEANKCNVIKPENRLSCLSWWKWDLSEDECTARGCCWDPTIRSIENLDWCYYPLDKTEMTKIHVVQGCHLDVGFVKTAPEIINLWFHHHFPMAYTVGKQLATDPQYKNTTARLRFTADSWLISLYMDCPKIYEKEGVKCPSESDKSKFKEAVANDWITWHAFPFNAEPEVLDSSLFSFGVSLTHSMDDLFKKPHKHTFSQRDVPGMTSSVIPLLLSEEVDVISVGSNGGSAPPNVPKAFNWVDPVSGKSIRTFFLQGGYGGLQIPYVTYQVTALPGTSEAMVVYWKGDNAGPPTVEQLLATFDILAVEYPQAKIVPSTFDTFAEAVANVPASNLPTLTGEIGDTWIHGIASDPLKLAQTRVIQNLRSSYLQAHPKEINNPAFHDFSRMLLKNSEHTWGLDVKVHIYSSVESNWSNKEFQKVKKTQPGFQALTNEWHRQRRMGLSDAVEALGKDHPLAKEINDELSYMNSHKNAPIVSGMDKLYPSQLPESFLLDNKYSISIDKKTGAITGWKDVTTNIDWGNEKGFIFCEYHTYDQQDYINFMHEYNYLGVGSIFPDQFDFEKVNIDKANATHREVATQLSAVYYSPMGTKSLSTQSNPPISKLILELTFPAFLSEVAGAPASVWLSIGAPSNTTTSVVNLDLQLIDKVPTRLPEAIFLRVRPQGSFKQAEKAIGNKKSETWGMVKLGEAVSPYNVFQGGSKHLHCVEAISRVGPQSRQVMSVIPVDSPLVCFGHPTSFPVPLSKDPDFDEGVSFILYDNIWNTNYIMWYPFDTASGSNTNLDSASNPDANILYRYLLDFTS